MNENNSQTIASAKTGPMKIAFLQAKWFADIVGEARKTFLTQMEDLAMACNS